MANCLSLANDKRVCSRPSSRSLRYCFYFACIITFLFSGNAYGEKVNYECSPKALKICANYGVASVSITGKEIANVTVFKILKDGKENKDISVKIEKKDPKFPDIISLQLFVVNTGIAPGRYSLGWDYDPVVVSFNLPITIISCPTNPKVDIIQNKYVQFEKYKEASIYMAMMDNVDPQKLMIFTDTRELLLNDPKVRRELMLKAFADEISGTACKIRDWFPKTVGAIGGTLVLVGENMTNIREVKIGDRVLTRLDVPVLQNNHIL